MAKKAKTKGCKTGLRASGRLAKGYKWPGGGRCPVKAGKAAKTQRVKASKKGNGRRGSSEKRELAKLHKWLEQRTGREADSVRYAASREEPRKSRDYDSGARGYARGYEDWKENNRAAGMDSGGAFSRYYRENVAGLEGRSSNNRRRRYF